MSARVASFTVAVAIGLSLNAACSSSPVTDASSKSEFLGTCPSGIHQCPAWAATCSGNELQTCVLDANGCRTLITETCDLGCNAGACNTCNDLAAPKEGSSVSNPTSFFGAAVRTGNFAIAAWTERDGIYVGKKTGLATIDLTDPNALTPVATLEIAQQTPEQLRMNGHTLYALLGGRLQIWDATNPSSLATLGSYAPADSALSLAVSSGVAFVGTSTGIEIVNVTNGSSPQMLSVIATSMPAYSLAVSGTRIAVAGNSAAAIMDVSDPTQPVQIAQTSLGGTIYGYTPDMLAFDGTHAYVVSGPLESFELTSVGKLEARGTLTDIGSASSLSLAGTDLTLTTREAVGVIDVSDPAALRWEKNIFFGKNKVSNVTGDGVMRYASVTDGLTAVDLSLAPDITMLPARGGPQQNGNYLTGSATFGSLAVLTRVSGLVIEDERNPQKPVVLSTTPMDAEDVVLDGSLAYVAVGNEGLRIYDVRSPWHPELVGSAQAPIEGQLSLDGNRAYAKCSLGYLCIFDVSDPAAPSLITSSDVMNTLVGQGFRADPFAMRGSKLYVGKADSLIIVDLANAAAPVKLAEVKIGGGINDDVGIAFTEDGGYAIATYHCTKVYADTCFDFVDVSDPINPQIVATSSRSFEINTDLYPEHNGERTLNMMHVRGHHLFLTNAWGGVSVIDIADPTHPKQMDELWTAMPARDHFVKGRFLTTYTSTGSSSPASSQPQDQVLELCK